MSRAQLLDRARRLAMRASLRARADFAPEGVSVFSLMLEAADGRIELIAHVRRLAPRRTGRRAKVSLPPPRDARQRVLF
jgi:hypothetical protein